MTTLILHGTWSPEEHEAPDGRFFLWAERVPARRRGRRKERQSDDGAPHPFQARPEEVRDAAVALSPTLARQVERSTWRLVRERVRLPTSGGVPLCSPEAAQLMVASGEDAGESVDVSSVMLGIWQVRGLSLEARRAVQLLASLPLHGQTGSSALVLGTEVRFWSAAAKLVLELLARERFIPALERVGAGFQVGWRALMNDPLDVQRLERLAVSQPAAVRALVPEAGGEAPAARQLLEVFIDSAVDSLARGWMAGGNARQLGPSRSVRTGRVWLEALRRGERVLRAGSSELEHLARRLAEWRAPLLSTAYSPYRTCFRLEPPGDQADSGPGTNTRSSVLGNGLWTLRIFLQATDDLSLLVPAERVWREPGSSLVYLKRRFDQPQEELLSGLGRAARSFAPLDRCLDQPRPAACYLTLEEAYDFLREAAWLLEENGFGVLVPPWWDRHGPRGRLGLRLKLRPPSQKPSEPSSGPLGEQSILEYDWRLAVGDSELSEAEFRQLAALKVPLVPIRGQWVELRPDKIEQAITFWEKKAQAESGRAQLPVSEALPLALAIDEFEGLPVLGVEAEGWVADLLGPAKAESLDGQARLAPVSTPPGFVGDLRPYQERGVGWLTFLSDRGLGACLADDMGLGKTIQYIAFLLHRRGPSSGLRPALLVCPTSVVGNWRHELERFAPDLRVLVHHGPGRSAGADFALDATGQDLVVTSYALLHRDRETLAGVAWDGVVLDEAQNVKNPATLQARAARTMPAKYRFALTGTPVENRLSELWSIVDFLNPGYLGTQNAFRGRFITPIERWQDRDRAEQLRRLVRPLVLRRLKTDPVISRDLPEKQEMKVFCTLTSEQATLYQAVVADMLAQIEASEGIQRRGLVLATLTRLKQVCNHPAHFLGDGSVLAGRSGKLDRLQEMLEEVLAEGDRALVFTQFAEFGARLRHYLQNHFGREALFLHGALAAQQRDSLVARFQQPGAGAPPIFVLSLRAGGVGLNLTEARHVFHFDRWWNPAVEDQATDRAFRIGQRRNVQVHKFVCAGTLEEKIDGLIESKKALAEVIGAGESWLTELSTADLQDILTLRASAVVE